LKMGQTYSNSELFKWWSLLTYDTVTLGDVLLSHICPNVLLCLVLRPY
jgi:hypothetical protein